MPKKSKCLQWPSSLHPIKQTNSMLAYRSPITPFHSLLWPREQVKSIYIELTNGKKYNLFFLNGSWKNEYIVHLLLLYSLTVPTMVDIHANHLGSTSVCEDNSFLFLRQHKPGKTMCSTTAKQVHCPIDELWGQISIHAWLFSIICIALNGQSILQPYDIL
jgi:hypothetical protein